MKRLNGWWRLWLFLVALYALAVLAAALFHRPKQDDVEIREVLSYLSTGTLTMMRSSGDDADWRKTESEGISVSVPVHLTGDPARLYIAEYLAAHRTALHKRRQNYVLASLGWWAVPSLLLLVFGSMAAWVRRGFTEAPSHHLH